MGLFDDVESVTTSPLPPSRGGQAPRLGIAERIERVRDYFELADNWPLEPFRLNAWSFVPSPEEFVDGHLTFLLSVQSDALALPYLGRIEFVMEMLQEMALLPTPPTPPEPESADGPPKHEAEEEELNEIHG